MDRSAVSNEIGDPWGVRSRVFRAALDTSTRTLDLRLVGDMSTLEIFAQDGTIVFSAVVAAADLDDTIKVRAVGGMAWLSTIALRKTDRERHQR